MTLREAAQRIADQVQHGPLYSTMRDIDRGISSLRDVHSQLFEEHTRLMSIQANTQLDMAGGLQTLNETVEAGFFAIVTALDNQTEVIEDVLRTLREPARTRAREMQQRGIHAYENGKRTGERRWFDDAVKDLTTALRIDRYDYRSHWLLGMIYALDLMDDKAAEDAFREAAHYGWPDDPYASALALVGLAFVLRANSRIEEAEHASRVAVERAPESALVRFYHAKCLNALKESGLAVEEIRSSIELDPRFWRLASWDADFRTCPGLEQVLENFARAASEDYRRSLSDFLEVARNARDALLRHQAGTSADIQQVEDWVIAQERVGESADYVDICNLYPALSAGRGEFTRWVAERLSWRRNEIRARIDERFAGSTWEWVQMGLLWIGIPVFIIAWIGPAGSTEAFLLGVLVGTIVAALGASGLKREEGRLESLDRELEHWNALTRVHIPPPPPSV